MNISPREFEVLELITQQHTTKEIAGLLYLSEHTVLSHRKKLMVKLNAKNSVGMVVRALESGLLKIN